MDSAEAVAETARRLGLVRLTTEETSAAEFRRRLRRGDVRRVRSGVFCTDPEQRPGFLEKVAAALMLLPPGTSVVGITAARLWRVDGLPGLRSTEPVHVAVPDGMPRRLSGVRCHVGRPAPWALVAGLPTAELPWTLMAVAATLDFSAGLAIVEAALYGNPELATDLQRALAAGRPESRSRQVREVVGFADSRSESPLESRARALWRLKELPQPIQQAVIRVNGRQVARVDFLWPEAMLIVEVDGAAKYAERGVLQQEKSRQNVLAAQGYTILRFTWADIVGRPDDVARHIRGALHLSA